MSGVGILRNPKTPGYDRHSPIDREKMTKLLASMDNILDIEEKTIQALDAIEKHLLENAKNMSADELKPVEAKLMELGTRFDTLTDSFDRIDEYLKLHGY